MTDPQFHLQRLGALRTDRSDWDQQWEEAAQRVYPAHVDTFTSRMSNIVSGGGDKKTDKQFDATVSFAALRFASVMESLVTPQNSVWHRMKATDPVLARNRQVREFFDKLNQVLFDYRYRPAGNFVGNTQQTYLSLGVYGNGIVYIDRPDKGKGLRYRNIHLAETYFVENHARIIDTVYRAYFLTARQMLQEEGWDVPQEIKEEAAQASQTEKKHEILHCVYPREDYIPGRMDGKGKPFASEYILVEKKHPLSEGGYDTFPYAITRYTQSAGEVYGRGPAQWALPAIKTLNEQKKTVLKQGHRIVDPVLLSHDDGTLGSFSLRAGALNPGGVNKDGKALVHVLPTGSIAVGDKMMEMEKAIIHDAFLITLFQILIDTLQMPATEVLERAREKGMLLAPTAGRQQAEFLGPMSEREIDLLARQGLLPRIPSILLQAETEYRFVYDNPMSRMQQAEKASGFMRALGTASEYAKMTGDLEPLDHFNFDVAMPEILDIHGAPVAWTHTMDEVQAKRDGRAAAVEKQQQVEQAPAMASVAKTASEMMPK